MFSIVTPISILHRQIERLQALLPGVYDGNLDSIHDARVATRRIREVLPLTHEWQLRHQVDDLTSRFKRMGRSLGRVRDADIRIEMLRYCEARIPAAGSALTVARQREAQKRLRRARKLIKRLERLSIDDELGRLATAAPSWRSQVWSARAGTWRRELRRLLADRASAARDAVLHASGVYFPRRAHEARLAIKKLRYAAEIAEEIGVRVDDAVIRELKKTADILGDQRDRQTLAERFADTKLTDGGDAGAHVEQARLIREVLEAEICELHTRYLEHRRSVLNAAERLTPDPGRVPVGWGVATVAGVVAVTGAGIIRRHHKITAGGSVRTLPTRTDDEEIAIRAAPAIVGRRN